MKSTSRDVFMAPPLGEVLEFMRLLWEVDHALQRTSKRMEITLGVTGPQRLVIRIIGRFPGIPAGHLARLLHLHPSTLTGIMERLGRQGLIRRRRDPCDGRRILLSLTDKGRRFEVETEGTVEAAVRSVLDRLPQARIAAARQVLNVLAAALDGREMTTLEGDPAPKPLSMDASFVGSSPAAPNPPDSIPRELE